MCSSGPSLNSGQFFQKPGLKLKWRSCPSISTTTCCHEALKYRARLAAPTLIPSCFLPVPAHTVASMLRAQSFFGPNLLDRLESDFLTPCAGKYTFRLPDGCGLSGFLLPRPNNLRKDIENSVVCWLLPSSRRQQARTLRFLAAKTRRLFSIHLVTVSHADRREAAGLRTSCFDP